LLIDPRRRGRSRSFPSGWFGLTGILLVLVRGGGELLRRQPVQLVRDIG
jgi:hypothetical protein